MKKVFIGVGLTLVVILIIALAASPSSKKSTTDSSTESTPTENVEQGKVEVKSHRRIDTGYYPKIVGEVVNNTGRAVTFVNITATLYDAAGEVTGTNFTYASNTTDSRLEPLATAPFEIFFTDAPTFETYKLDVTWS